MTLSGGVWSAHGHWRKYPKANRTPFLHWPKRLQLSPKLAINYAVQVRGNCALRVTSTAPVRSPFITIRRTQNCCKRFPSAAWWPAGLAMLTKVSLHAHLHFWKLQQSAIRSTNILEGETHKRHHPEIWAMLRAVCIHATARLSLNSLPLALRSICKTEVWSS